MVVVVWQGSRGEEVGGNEDTGDEWVEDTHGEDTKLTDENGGEDGVTMGDAWEVHTCNTYSNRHR
jgi:hypothetical protein